jgi:SAM-dependent methyltransferase
VAHKRPSVELVGDVTPIEHNREVYRRAAVVEEYERAEGLQPPEWAALRRAADEVRGGAVLDLGVGGGRTTPYLTLLAGTYVAVDWSLSMVEACRRKHPGLDVRRGDARALAGLDDKTFDLVVFSFNGIDYVGHEDRLRILAEVRRVLRPRGLFWFSTHNLDSPDARRGYSLPWLTPSLNPVKLAVHLGRFGLAAVRRLRNYRRNRGLTVRTEEYALLCDGAHDHALMTYYVDQPAQEAQLARAGFTLEAVFDINGKEAPSRSRSPWLTYLARST